MDSTRQTPTWAQIIRAAVDAGAARLRVHLPARVESYNEARGTVSVVPLLREVADDGDGGQVVEDLPVLNEVPVEWPGAGGFRLTFPVQRGDTGVLSFHDRALDEWKSSTEARLVTPQDVRRHHLADATFRPGVRSPAAPWTGARLDAVTLGFDDGRGGGMQLHLTKQGIALGESAPAYAVALAEKVLSALQDIASKFNGHTHGTSQGPTTTPADAPTPTQITAPTSVGSSTVKVKE
ncbi:Gp138 family membrane-puncturing spike protein [Corallococcus sp. EGB]|uniref:Gp138 family membrane-puncturing spike protein n=1 Tax=Corallococcus sp. EGB TaxID=1521117 RepID=UPI001CBD39C8|nr:Gp138 family membrane-puncturing spike protein [Corallococcus sp. EGB]